jgi:hypothetical protein
MVNCSIIRHFLILCLLIFASWSRVFAAVISFPINGLTLASYVGGRQVLIPQFDPSRGTLVSANISFTPEFEGTISGTATGPMNNPVG